MKLIQNIVTTLYNALVPDHERQAEAVATLTDNNRAALAISYFTKEAPILTDKEMYNKALSAANKLVLTHNNAATFKEMCFYHVRRTASSVYFKRAALNSIICSVTDSDCDLDEGCQIGRLFDAIKTDLQLAKEEKSFLKRRSIIQKAVKHELPGLNSDNLRLVVELIIDLELQ